MTVNVLLEIKNMELDKTFTYLVPEQLKSKVAVGKRVKVPFGKKTIVGFVMKKSLDQEHDFALKEIIEVIDDQVVLNDELLKLGEYLKTKTLSTLIHCYQTMLPVGAKASIKNVIKGEKPKYLKIKKDVINQKISEKGQAVLDLFQENEYISKKEANKISTSAVKTLLKNKIVIEIEEPKLKKELQRNNFNLTIEQKECLKLILKKQTIFHPFLLHGVTGSGKTEIYLQTAKKVLQEGKSIIVLVPEISLTPQIVERFVNHFGEQVAVFHSGLSPAEKYLEYQKILKGQVKIVVGARSAIFVPLKKIGLIVVDEEHSLTYKQDNMPRYHALDVAIWRGQYHKCPVILASATPSIESYTRAQLGIYTLLEMPKPINQLTKEIEIIDMKDELRKGQRYLSKKLLKNIQQKIEKNEQVILFLNRRGYSTTLVCIDCGAVVKCPHCEISLTYHKQRETLECHYCQYKQKIITKCAVCEKGKLRHFGLGTQKLAEIVINEISGAKVIRMDVDTTRKRGSHAKIIQDFASEKYNILIGTQMISKGLDFLNVTLVGIINGDASLNLPDFRSSERTFQLINQVAGRGGRAEKSGKVILQCFNPDHYSIKYALENNYQKFYDEEIKMRKVLNYPPFVNLTLIKVSAADPKYLFTEATKIANIFAKNKRLEVLGPVKDTVFRVNKRHYANIIIKYQYKADIVYELNYLQQLNIKKNLKIDIDINPLRV